MKNDLDWNTRLSVVKGLLKDLENEVKELEKMFKKKQKTTNTESLLVKGSKNEKQQEAT